MIVVPFLNEAQIEVRSDALLEAFRRERGPILAPPVPVEDQLLFHLGLRLHMDDLHARFSVPRTAGRVDILAGLWIEDREIRIDESLDPEVNPAIEGRYYFSIGHEIGHWELHRHQILAALAEPVLLVQPESTVVCRNEDVQLRSSKKFDVRARMEHQANKFSACLLMPRFLVQAAWLLRFNNLDPVFVEDRARSAPELRLLPAGTARSRPVFAIPIARQTLEDLISEIASEFRTSRQAMRIRLQKLGFIYP